MSAKSNLYKRLTTMGATGTEEARAAIQAMIIIARGAAPWKKSEDVMHTRELFGASASAEARYFQASSFVLGNVCTIFCDASVWYHRFNIYGPPACPSPESWARYTGRLTEFINTWHLIHGYNHLLAPYLPSGAVGTVVGYDGPITPSFVMSLKTGVMNVNAKSGVADFYHLKWEGGIPRGTAEKKGPP